MISKMNYLLLITVMTAVIDNSYGRCCPCEKKKVKPSDDNEVINILLPEDNNQEGNIPINNNNIGDLINNETIENENKNIDNQDNDQPLNQEQIDDQEPIEYEVKAIINEALKIETICGDCINNTKTKNKITVVYDVTKDTNDTRLLKFKSSRLKFGFCEKHKTCQRRNCDLGAVLLIWCGHRRCQADCSNVLLNWYECPNCKGLNCDRYCIENFGKHIWCNDKNNEHYVCFDKKLSESPYGKNDYKASTWLCPKHRDQQTNNKK